jgi:hypothetical protein
VAEGSLGDGEVAYRPRCIGAQRLAERRQFEAVRSWLGEDTDAGQQPQHAEERPWLRADRLRKLRAATRASSQLVGNAQPRNNAERLADPVAGDELQHHLGQRASICLRCTGHGVSLLLTDLLSPAGARGGSLHEQPGVCGQTRLARAAERT